MQLKKLSLMLSCAAVLSGCAFTDFPEEKICFSDDGQMMNCTDIQRSNNGTNSNGNSSAFQDASLFSNDIARLEDPTLFESNVSTLQDPSLFTSNVNFVLLSEYVEQMAMDLKKKLPSRLLSSVAVTSFVTLDSTLQNSTLLGNLLSEYFINELGEVNIPVSDYKVMGMIKVSPTGDFAMSRELYELRENVNMGYVLTGTLVEDERGVVVNARIVSLLNNQVVSSTSKLIPTLVWSSD